MSQCERCYGELDSVCKSCDPDTQDLLYDNNDQYDRIQQLERLITQAGEHPLVMQEGGYNNIDRCHRVINKLVGAIREHKDQFVDEALEGEKKLWSVLEI